MKEDADAINSALKVALADRGYFLTRSVIICESLNPSGARTITCVGSEDLRAWEAMGLLDYGRELGVAQIHGELVDGDE